jgi:hypothetical protein
MLIERINWPTSSAAPRTSAPTFPNKSIHARNQISRSSVRCRCHVCLQTIIFFGICSDGCPRPEIARSPQERLQITGADVTDKRKFRSFIATQEQKGELIIVRFRCHANVHSPQRSVRLNRRHGTHIVKPPQRTPRGMKGAKIQFRRGVPQIQNCPPASRRRGCGYPALQQQ